MSCVFCSQENRKKALDFGVDVTQAANDDIESFLSQHPIFPKLVHRITRDKHEHVHSYDTNLNWI